VKQTIDLIVLPENLVPYGAYHHVFPIEEIQNVFQELFGDVSEAFPTQDSPYIDLLWVDQGAQWFVSNAYVAQTLADFFQAHVVIGLEDSLYVNQQKGKSYSSAFHFIPGSNQLPKRYDKRVLVPMGEYLPFAWCQQLAARYGIGGSFTPGQCAKVFDGPIPFGASICYEEMYGDLMRENRVQGAELLVNLTNDGWYPESALPKQHFDHARLRTVENGIPLARACNTGITGAIDSLGRIVGVLGKDDVCNQQVADSIRLDIPLYHYQTLYSRYGDLPVISFACLCVIGGIIRRKKFLF
jgi:apolipoprotein N-acyltransferase